MSMFFLGFCAKARPAFLSKGSLLVTCRCPAFKSASQLSVLARGGYKQVKILETESLAHVIMKRQIRLKPSERKTKLQKSGNNWDKVPSDFSLIYENGLKNYIWGFYILQATLAASCCLFAAYKLQALLDVSSERDLQMMFLCCSVYVASFAYYNIIATRTCIRIYHNSQSGQFIAVRRTIFGRLQKTTYTTSDVTIYKKESDDAKMQILIKVKGKKYRLLSCDFVSPIYFNMHFDGASYKY
ncbi:hypothetical protein BsWGS_15918 [Bradybaena similaris]